MKKIIISLIIIGSLTISFLSGFYFRENDYFGDVKNVLSQTSIRRYDYDKYNCVDFSKDTQKLLREKGIESVVIYGSVEGMKTDHAVIGILVDPQNGKFVENMTVKGILK